MRIGIVPSLNRYGGGTYQYSLTMMEALCTLQEQGLLDDEFVIFSQGGNEDAVSRLIEAGWKVVPLKLPVTFRQRVLSVARHILGNGRARQIGAKFYSKFIPKPSLPDPDRITHRPDLARPFLKEQVDWLLYPAPVTMSFEAGIPYVMAVHDLQHRLQPEFPEVSANGEWEWREYLFRNGVRYAMMILVDSEVGKEDVLEFYAPYGVTPDRVKVLPFLPAHYLSTDVTLEERERIRKVYQLPERYLFYPAQFWPHKNHLRIIQALSLLKKEHSVEVDIVFAGSYTGEIMTHNFQEVMSLTHQSGLEKRVHYLGYVPEEDMSALYAEAVALIFPTFFGPTNIPPLEAWSFGCPVITSDIRGIREQMGEAAVLVDPKSVESIANGIYRVWTDEELRQTLAERGRQRLSTYTPEDFRQRLAGIVEEAKRLAVPITSTR
jgi:glycosyltransferase involved in cell wall biosynthesis